MEKQQILLASEIGGNSICTEDITDEEVSQFEKWFNININGDDLQCPVGWMQEIKNYSKQFPNQKECCLKFNYEYSDDSLSKRMRAAVYATKRFQKIGYNSHVNCVASRYYPDNIALYIVVSWEK